MIVPGTIVVVDDDPVIAESEICTPLQKRGERVKYLAEIPEECKEIINPRMLIIDWDLSGSGSLELITNGGLVVQNIHNLTRISTLCLIVVWSIFADSDKNKEIMKETIVKMYNASFKPNKIQPEDIKIMYKFNADEMLPTINEWISNNHSAGLIFEWEKSLELARDKLVTQISNSNIKALVKMVSDQLGNGTDRYLSNLFSTILLRGINTHNTNFSKCLEQLTKNTPTTTDLIWYAKFHNLQSYYFVNDKENIMTGDIYLMNKEEPEKIDSYGLIINCLCDFYQRNVNIVRVLHGTKISKIPPYTSDNVNEKNFIPHNYGWRMDKGERNYKSRGSMIQQFVEGKIQARYYRLLFVINHSEESYYHLYFDFNRVSNHQLPLNDENIPILPSEWVRICRVDSPIIGDLLQKYSSYCSRVGIPSLPDIYVAEEIKKMKEIDVPPAGDVP